MPMSAHRALLAVIALCATAPGFAQQQYDTQTIQRAMEVPAKSVTLPITATSPAVMPTCWKCPPKSFPVTASTTYYEGEKVISLADMKSIAAQYPNIALTVKYDVASGNLVSITADIPASLRRDAARR